MTKIAIIVGSTRQGRQSHRLAKWVAKHLGEKADVEVLDLVDYPMPFLDEAISPRYNPDRQIPAEAQPWLKKLESSRPGEWGHTCFVRIRNMD